MADASDRREAEQPLGTDRPITTDEQDRLGYTPFAQAIAKSVVGRAPADSIVLAIHGPWGSGKTSAVNLIVEAVEALQKGHDDERATLIVRFNPWWFSEQLNLTRTFFAELSAALDQKINSRVAEGLRRIGRRVSGTKELLALGLGMVPGAGAAAPLIKAGIEALQPHLEETTSIGKIRSELVEALNEQDKRVLVIIDDIDRLPADECRQILRLVKSVADLPRITYMLVFDREVVRRALGETATGEPEWLEKIVQGTFDLPPVHPADLRQMFIDGLNRIIGETEVGDEVRAGNVLHDAVFPWLRTPRDVGRLLNAISVVWPAVHQDVNVIDLVAIETLRVFENRVFILVRDNQNSVTGLDRDREEANTQLGKELKEAATAARRDRIEDALMRLFPRLERIWRNQTYGGDFMTGWDRELRICSARRFPAYFQFSPGEDVLRRSDINELASTLSNRDGLLDIARRGLKQKRRSGASRTDLLLDEIRVLADSVHDDEVPDIYLNLMHAASAFAQSLIGQTPGGFDIPVTWKINFALKPFFHRLAPEDRVKLLAQAIDEVPDLISANFSVTVIEGEHGRFKDTSAKTIDKRSVDEGGLLMLRERLRDRICEMANAGILLRQIEPLPLLHRWADLSSQETVQDWTSTVIENDKDALELARASIGIGTSHGSGDRVSRVHKSVNKQALSLLVDIEKFSERLKDIIQRGGDPDGTARDFLKAVEAESLWDD